MNTFEPGAAPGTVHVFSRVADDSGQIVRLAKKIPCGFQFQIQLLANVCCTHEQMKCISVLFGSTVFLCTVLIKIHN